MKARKISNPVLACLLLCLTCLICTATVSAQQTDEQAVPGQPPSIEMREDFSDGELKSFVKANEKVTVIQMEAEQKMIKAIEDEGLSVERFNAIGILQDEQKSR